jgi:hypothetical protein
MPEATITTAAAHQCHFCNQECSQYKVPFILIETVENSSKSPPNTTLASAAVFI